MTTFNVGGLVSGIDTNSLIDQLMTAAAAPQTAEETQLSNQQTVNALYQALNTKMSAIGTAATTLTQSATWQATTATSSSSSVVATGSASAQAGSYTSFNVNRIATAQITTVAVSGSTVVSDPTQGIDIVGADGTSHHVALADGTPASVASAVNNAGLGVRAALISTDGGQVLQFTSTSTGAQSKFTINGLSAPSQDLVSAQDAQIQVGDLASGGYTVSSASNTFANAIPGVTFTVSAPATNVTISVASDQTSISNNVKALVDAVNSGLSVISSDTAQGAMLEGDSTSLTLQQKLLSVVSQGTSTGGSFSTYGISITSTGQLTFDADNFAAAYAADPTGTQAALQNSFAPAFSTIANSATDSGSGTLTQLISSGNDTVTQLNSEIADWTTKLADQRTQLQAKYAAMETALAKLKSVSSYLNSVFNPSSSSSSSSSSSGN